MYTTAIKLTNITKKYTIHHEKPTLVEKFVKGRDETFTALNTINLTINKGEKVGIIGPNGSGKTTLLKIIAGITNPTSGVVKTNGRIVSLIDMEAGFHPDLTGYQNIFLNAMLLGMTKSEINEKLSPIINFSGIKQFIDVPLYTYSNGMILRLGFSIAIHSDPHIFVLDENLSASDKEFQKKAEKRIKHLFSQGLTILMVSHIIPILKSYCQRFIVLEQGAIIRDGGKSILSKYQK